MWKREGKILMNDLVLVRPSKEMEKDIWEYRQEYLLCGEKHINGCCGIGYYDDFDTWLEFVLAIGKDKMSREGVHASTFFSVRKSDNKIIGSIQLRHFLTEDLKKHGGHIGYGIRPGERGKGYGRQQQLLVLEEAAKMGIPRVMISCDKDNIPSGHTAMSCGGVLECENCYKGREQQIYWITL